MFLKSLIQCLIMAFLLCIPAWGAVAEEPERPNYATSTLVIETAEGPRRFEIELAINESEKAFGLMFVRAMPDNQGMLFDYPDNTPVSMWMKNTFIPLDMLFIRSDGTIRKIVQNTVPHSLKAINSGGPVRAVIELNAGTADRLKIRRNDLVRHPIFGSATTD